MKPILPRLILLCLTAATLPAMADTAKQCGTLEWNYGPYDYRTANAQQRKLVESAHFTPEAEDLREAPTGSFGADFKYTLSVFPNHPRALLAMERLVVKEKRNPANGAKYTIECFYERAMRFKPDDHIPRLLYVNFLLRQNKLDEARTHLDYVAETTKEDPFAQFNVGMLYADMKDYDKALVQAHRVIAMGYDRPELRDRLIAVGRWVAPAPVADAASAPASAASQ
ncbi:ABC transporter permease [Roseateles sp.]|uniref:tetratricopeptide repeat protein n=1 Tax=Roseateles sp. TaxID=1971397 RepID=UPI0025D587DE|nr:ABC transporter permease [Roseateles sp.]MBV8036905.1 ABC transporter permease [Roseateles sp.]